MVQDEEAKQQTSGKILTKKTKSDPEVKKSDNLEQQTKTTTSATESGLAQAKILQLIQAAKEKQKMTQKKEGSEQTSHQSKREKPSGSPSKDKGKGKLEGPTKVIVVEALEPSKSRLGH